MRTEGMNTIGHLNIQKKRVWSTPSYYGNSHLRLTYQRMVVVRAAAKWTRSGSAFGGGGVTWIAPRPSVTFGLSANEPRFRSGSLA